MPEICVERMLHKHKKNLHTKFYSKRSEQESTQKHVHSHIATPTAERGTESR